MADDSHSGDPSLGGFGNPFQLASFPWGLWSSGNADPAGGSEKAEAIVFALMER